MKTTTLLAALAGAAVGAPALAQPVIDGQLDTDFYGSQPQFVQTVPTGFGDNADPDEALANGSEIDNVYAVYDDQALYLFIAGNVESNFNKLDLFFDVHAGGQNTLRTDNVDIDFNGLNRMGGPVEVEIDPDGEGPLPPELVTQPGLTFDEGFAADYWLTFTIGSRTEDPDGMPDSGDEVIIPQNYSNAAVLRTNGVMINDFGEIVDYGAYDGGDRADHNPIDYAGPLVDPILGPQPYTNFAPRLTGQNPNSPVAGLVQISINNANTAGVVGLPGTDVSGAAAVQTGVEIRIDLAELGWDPGSGIPLRIAGFINGGDHGFVSNQVIGGLPADFGNLAEPRTVNFAGIAGDQFVVAISADDVTDPCPADWDGNEAVNVQDLIAFLQAFGAGDADFDDNGSTNVQDLIGFLQAFGAGC